MPVAPPHRDIASDQASLSAQQLAYAHIRAGILDGTYPGGLWLKAKEIADRLQLSRMPVREALCELDVEGLVTLRPNRGALVTKLSAGDVDDSFAMSAALVALAGGLAVANLTDRALADLELLCRSMDQSRGDVQVWMERHDAFHDYLARLCRRRLIIAELARLRSLIHPYLRMYLDVNRDSDLPDYEHHALLEVLRSRNSALIEVGLRAHVLQAARGCAAFIQQASAAPPSGMASGVGVSAAPR
jgi:DNA-binding GntR family transcriptional regulator